MEAENKARKQGDDMILRLNGETRIDNLRNYPAEVVEKLRALLSAGANAEPDPHRENFYDITNGVRKFYIHLSPRGSVWLLSSWLKPVQAPAQDSACLVAHRS